MMMKSLNTIPNCVLRPSLWTLKDTQNKPILIVQLSFLLSTQVSHLAPVGDEGCSSDDEADGVGNHDYGDD